MKKNLFGLLFFALLGTQTLIAQEDTLIRQQLRGKQNFSEIMNTVTTYYTNPETINRLGPAVVKRSLKYWNRYEWYMSSRLGPNGEFVNINQKMLDATGLNGRLNTSTNKSENTASISGGAWTAVGPFNTTNGIGRVDRLAFHPTNPDIVYAGTTAGGLWRTTNAGVTWANLTPDIPSGGISGIIVDPINPNTLYILTGDGDSNIPLGLVINHGYMRLSIGVLKSTNGGTTWAKTGDFPGVDYSTLVGHRLIMHPSDNNTIYACTNQGLFMSINGGTSWGLIKGDARFFNLKFKPGSNNICYTTSIRSDNSNAYLWKSTNSGLTWDTVNAATNILNAQPNRTEIAVTPANPNLLYLLPGSVTGIISQFTGFWISSNEGSTFTRKSQTPNILSSDVAGDSTDEQSMYDLTLAVSNINSANVVTGAVNIWQSSDTGSTWVVRPDTHGDIHDLGFHPANNKLWAATDGGVFSSTNSGATWTSHFEGMNITQFYRMAVSPDNYLDMIGGSQDNAVKKRSGGTSNFDQILCCDGFALGYDPINTDTIFAVNNNRISRSFDGGANFTNVSPPNTTNPFSMAMAVHTSLSNALFLGSSSFFRSTNGGNTWNAIANLPSGWFIRTCPSNGNRVYIAGGTSYSSASGSLKRSDDGGVTISSSILSENPGFPEDFPKITSINVDPNTSNNVWVTFGGFMDGVKVYFSNDAGANWFPRNGTLPNVPVNCIALDINNNAYIGTDNGVYYRSTSMTDWVPFYNNLPYVPVTELIISEADNRIRASTFGRGIWSSELYSNCETDLNITGTLEGQEFYEASNNISSTASLLTSLGSKVQMRGGNEVVLQPGFTARETTQFRAAIGPCGSGGVAGFRMPEKDSVVKIPPRQYLPPAGGIKSIIHIHTITNNEIQFEITQKQNGETDLLLTDEAGNIIRSKKFTASATGKWANSISTAGLAKGMYYLQVLLDKRVEHMQEVEIR